MEPALQITDKEFIAKHDSFFELVDSGKPLLIRWGNDRYFHLLPATLSAAAAAAEVDEPEDVYEPEDDGFCYAPGLLKRIKAAQQQYREGKGTICRTHEELTRYLDSL